MTESIDDALVARLRQRVLTYYYAAAILMLLGIGVLALYSFQLGPLVGPGVEQSFGIAVALMFIMGAVSAHLLDKMYRAWPLGRRFRPSPPAPICDRDWAMALSVAVLVTAGGSIAYVLAGLLS